MEGTADISAPSKVVVFSAGSSQGVGLSRRVVDNMAHCTACRVIAHEQERRIWLMATAQSSGSSFSGFNFAFPGDTPTALARSCSLLTLHSLYRLSGSCPDVLIYLSAITPMHNPACKIEVLQGIYFGVDLLSSDLTQYTVS